MQIQPPVKLIIQIPCYNEEQTLPETVADLPRQISGIDVIEYLIIDDGSTDRTSEVARELGIHHIVRFSNNKGLARGFSAGIERCLSLGADIIVNTDADNQYYGADIAKLVQPILEGRADMVVGDRNTDDIEHFSPIKKRLQTFGSWVVRQLSGTEVPDATSGFRAYSREAALRMNVVSEFTYTLETIIQAGKQAVSITHVPIRTNSVTRESRLFKSMGSYIKRSAATMLRVYTMYEPLKMFSYAGLALMVIGGIPGLRFLFLYLAGDADGHIQSLIFSAIFIILGFQVFILGVVADLIGANRKLVEKVLYLVKKGADPLADRTYSSQFEDRDEQKKATNTTDREAK
jgi:glycosyltransferase involved in cell wall biosynthesis